MPEGRRGSRRQRPFQTRKRKSVNPLRHFVTPPPLRGGRRRKALWNDFGDPCGQPKPSLNCECQPRRIKSKKRATWSAQLQLRILVRGPVFASTCAAGAAHSHVFSLTSAVCLRPSRSSSGLWGHSPKGDGPSVPLRPQTDISTLETALWIRHSLHQSVSMTAYLSDMN